MGGDQAMPLGPRWPGGRHAVPVDVVQPHGSGPVGAAERTTVRGERDRRDLAAGVREDMARLVERCREACQFDRLVRRGDPQRRSRGVEQAGGLDHVVPIASLRGEQHGRDIEPFHGVRRVAFGLGPRDLGDPPGRLGLAACHLGVATLPALPEGRP